MCKTSVICTFVNNHCIFHIISSVGDDSNNSIGSTWTQSKIIIIEVYSSYQWGLWKKQPINFVIHTVWMVVVRSSHCLLTHLTLIHVSGTLIIVTERNN